MGTLLIEAKGEDMCELTSLWGDLIDIEVLVVVRVIAGTWIKKHSSQCKPTQHITPHHITPHITPAKIMSHYLHQSTVLLQGAAAG